MNKIFRTDIIIHNMIVATSEQIQEIEEQINDIQDNIFLDTSTWGLEICEKELNVQYLDDKTIEERKEIVSASWRGAGKLTLELIQDTAKAFTDLTVKVTYEDGYLVFDFSEKLGIPKSITSLKDQLEVIKPAHLGAEYVFRFRKWSEATHYSWRILNETKTSWRSLREDEYNNADYYMMNNDES